MIETGESRLIEGIDYFKVTEGIWGMRDGFVNIYMISNVSETGWVLLDTGLASTGKKIQLMAREIFGDGTKPACILLTHAHFDHVGSLKMLSQVWDVPVYAHPLEIPYLTARAAYPPPDSSIGGGMMAKITALMPEEPLDMQDRITPLPSKEDVPGLPGWTWIHTPGHSPGHISLFRADDRALMSGDAIITTNMESFWSNLFQLEVLSGPPKYYTYDWREAQASVNKLWMLEPELIASGHGRPMHGHEMRTELNTLEKNFQEDYIPSKGRYVEKPAIADERGFIYIPAKKLPFKKIAIGSAIAGALLFIAAKKLKKKKHKDDGK